MNYNIKAYLNNSEKRIEKLRKIINGRPVVILAAGPSLSELERRIYDLKKIDICYFGFNSFIQEKNILKKINKKYSVYMDSCSKNIPLNMQYIYNFLDNPDDNIFISSFYNDTFGQLGKEFGLKDFLKKYDDKLLFFYLSWLRSVPNSSQPLHFIASNSLLIMIEIALIGKPSSIMLFGADGGVSINKKKIIYILNKKKRIPLW